MNEYPRSISATTICRERPPWRSAVARATYVRRKQYATEGVPYRVTPRVAVLVVFLLAATPAWAQREVRIRTLTAGALSPVPPRAAPPPRRAAREAAARGVCGRAP